MITVIYFWRIKKIYLPWAILNMATNKFLLKVMLGKSFIKMLGTGKGESFTPKDASLIFCKCMFAAQPHMFVRGAQSEGWLAYFRPS